MNSLTVLHHRLTHNLVTAASTRPSIYFTLRKLLRAHDDQCVNRATEIVIEGFPRSANSTTVRSFVLRQPRPVRVAHHKHHAAQLLRAQRWNIPAVVLIRPPERAALSLLALAQETRIRQNKKNREHFLGFSDVLRSWIQFYSAVLPYVDDMVVAPFDVVTQDVAPFISHVNKKWGTDFEARDTVFNREVEETVPPMLKPNFHATPNITRQNIISSLQEEFSSVYDRSATLRALLSEANEIHDAVIAHAKTATAHDQWAEATYSASRRNSSPSMSTM